MTTCIFHFHEVHWIAGLVAEVSISLQLVFIYNNINTFLGYMHL